MQLKITLGLGLVKVVPAKSASAVMDSFDFFVSSTTPSAPVLTLYEHRHRYPEPG
jgi:hypothetical protein